MEALTAWGGLEGAVSLLFGLLSGWVLALSQRELGILVSKPGVRVLISATISGAAILAVALLDSAEQPWWFAAMAAASACAGHWLRPREVLSWVKNRMSR